MRGPRLDVELPNVAFDGKLWIWWDSLDFNASQLEAHLRLSLDGERLEATYEAIILQNGTQVSPDCTSLMSHQGRRRQSSKRITGSRWVNLDDLACRSNMQLPSWH